MNYLDKARALRADTQRHYNCCQSVLVPFAGALGLDEEEAYRLGANFGSGMRMGSVCGALTGALMALGMLGYGEQEARALIQQFRSENGCVDCAQLLAGVKARGEVRKDHCDRMVFQCVQALEELLAR